MKLSSRKRAVLEVMSKPKTPAELREQIGLKRGNNMSSTIKELLNLNLIYCLNPKAMVGKLYGLTGKGQRLRKKLGVNNYSQSDDINWKLYGWVVCGRQKRALLKAMSINISLPLKYIKERAQDKYNPKISRTNANDILQLFVRKRLALKNRQGNRVFFRLTIEGQKIKEQLTKP
jgi:hypothetical protein